MNYIKTTVLCAVTGLLCACNSKYENAGEAKKDMLVQELSNLNQAASDKEKYQLADSIGLQQADETDKKQQPSTLKTIPVDWDKKIIKTATLNVEVKDYNSYYANIKEKIKSMGGYIAQEHQTASDFKMENTVSIKIPVDQFDNAVDAVTASGQKVNEKNISSQDVTRDVVDARSRMEAKRQVRQRYMELLQQARSMEDILTVQSNINNIQEEIESAAGRIQHLGHSSAFSTIQLTYYQVINATAGDSDNPSFFVEVRNAFQNGWSWIGGLFVGLVTIWPLLIVFAFAYMVYKKVKQSTRAKEA
jgi:Domain of unknown function (DUF4349)